MEGGRGRGREEEEEEEREKEREREREYIITLHNLYRISNGWLHWH